MSKSKAVGFVGGMVGALLLVSSASAMPPDRVADEDSLIDGIVYKTTKQQMVNSNLVAKWAHTDEMIDGYAIKQESKTTRAQRDAYRAAASRAERRDAELEELGEIY